MKAVNERDSELMFQTTTKRVVVAATAVLMLSALVTTAATAVHEGSKYRSNLVELNDSGGSGLGTLTVSDDGETMRIQISARGLNLDGPHAMHLHGKVEGDTVLASTCPTMADDADGDGVLTVVEGGPKYGGVQVSLTTTGDTSADSALAVDRYPAGTSINYDRSGIPIPDALKPELGKVHFVIHGVDENGNGSLDLDQDERSSLTDDLPREGTAPALCGTLTVVAQGQIQTGGGGLADNNGSSSVALAVVAGAAVAVTASVALRRQS